MASCRPEYLGATNACLKYQRTRGCDLGSDDSCPNRRELGSPLLTLGRLCEPSLLAFASVSSSAAGGESACFMKGCTLYVSIVGGLSQVFSA